MRKNNNKQKNKKSIWYEIIVGIMSFIFVALLVSFIAIMLTEDYSSKTSAVDIYYYITSEDIYSPFDIYEHIITNEVLGMDETEDLKQVSAYGKYFMDSFIYNGTRNSEKQTKYKAAMEQDTEDMGELSGLSYRIDRYFERWTL